MSGCLSKSGWRIMMNKDKMRKNKMRKRAHRRLRSLTKR
jgi:hypothetical protein